MDLPDYLTSELVHFFLVFSFFFFFFLLSIFRLFLLLLSFLRPFSAPFLSSSPLQLFLFHPRPRCWPVSGWLVACWPAAVNCNPTHTASEREKERITKRASAYSPTLSVHLPVEIASQFLSSLVCRVLWLELLPKFPYLKAVKLLGFDGREKVADRFWSVQVFRRLCPSFSGDRNLLKTDKPKYSGWIASGLADKNRKTTEDVQVTGNCWWIVGCFALHRVP